MMAMKVMEALKALISWNLRHLSIPGLMWKV